MHAPRIGQIFDCENVRSSPGLSRFLSGSCSDSPIVRNGNERLHLIPAGPLPPMPVELLANDRFAMLVQRLEKRYDRVIVDGPPFLGLADGMIISQHVGGVILVCGIGETRRDALREFKKKAAD